MERIEKLKFFLQENPGDGFLKHALALQYVKMGDDIRAQNIWVELLEAQPDYVGSYYHLGKLYERKGEEQQAIKVYEKGMEMAKIANDNHAYNELKGTWEALAEL